MLNLDATREDESCPETVSSRDYQIRSRAISTYPIILLKGENMEHTHTCKPLGCTSKNMDMTEDRIFHLGINSQPNTFT